MAGIIGRKTQSHSKAKCIKGKHERYEQIYENRVEYIDGGLFMYIHVKVRNQGKLQSNMFIPHYYIAFGSARPAEPTWQTAAISGHDAQPIVEPRSAWIIS